MGKLSDARAPGQAYHEVAAWLGDDWFTKQAPQVGRLLCIMGRDGVTTRWHVDRLTGSRLADWVHDQPGLACVRIAAYDRRHTDGGLPT